MFHKILIANRGEIAVRIARTARRMGVATVAVYSDADDGAPHVLACDEAVRLGAPPPADSYLKVDRVVDAARRTGAEAIHPGYGFLSENAAFADAVESAGLAFVGPRAETIRVMGSKSAAKDLMESAGVPTTPGYQGEDQSVETMRREADRIGYPVLLKATAGGGGKGMRVVESASDLAEAFASAQREAKSSFGDDRVLIERYIPALAILKSRSSATATARSSICSKEIVQSNGVTKKSSKRRPPRAWRLTSGRASTRSASTPARPSTIAAPARLNASMTARTASTSWK